MTSSQSLATTSPKHYYTYLDCHFQLISYFYWNNSTMKEKQFLPPISPGGTSRHNTDSGRYLLGVADKVDEIFHDKYTKLFQSCREELQQAKRKLQEETEKSRQYRTDYLNYKMSWSMDQAEIRELKAENEQLKAKLERLLKHKSNGEGEKAMVKTGREGFVRMERDERDLAAIERMERKLADFQKRVEEFENRAVEFDSTLPEGQWLVDSELCPVHGAEVSTLGKGQLLVGNELCPVHGADISLADSNQTCPDERCTNCGLFPKPDAPSSLNMERRVTWKPPLHPSAKLRASTLISRPKPPPNSSASLRQNVSRRRFRVAV